MNGKSFLVARTIDTGMGGPFISLANTKRVSVEAPFAARLEARVTVPLMATACPSCFDGVAGTPATLAVTGFPVASPLASAIPAKSSCLAPAPRCGDELRQVAVRLAVGCEQHQLRPLRDPELGADDELDAVLLRGDVGAHHARKRAFIGDGERSVAQLRRARGKLLRVRGAAQEGEVGQAMEFCVGGKRRNK